MGQLKKFAKFFRDMNEKNIAALLMVANVAGKQDPLSFNRFVVNEIDDLLMKDPNTMKEFLDAAVQDLIEELGIKPNQNYEATTFEEKILSKISEVLIAEFKSKKGE